MAGVEAGDERSGQRLDGIVEGLKTASKDNVLGAESLACYVEAQERNLIDS